MQLSPEQTKALDKIYKWHKSKSQKPLHLAGYAGTGKTTLLQEFINGLDVRPLCCAPTGKAASVLARRLTNATVSTVHKALYVPVSQNQNKLDELVAELIAHPDNIELQLAVAEEKKRLADKGVSFSINEAHGISPGSLCIIDEASMVTSKMYSDLQDTGARVLYVGDPGQLPPVKDSSFFDVNPPDIMLTEVLRQALESPITRLSTLVRKGEEPEHNFDWTTDQGICRRISKSTLPEEAWLQSDQVITGKNVTRHGINRFFRNKLKRTGWVPQDGEKLVCLKNSKFNGSQFVNGAQATAIGPFKVDEEFNTLTGSVLWEGMIVKDIPVYEHHMKVHYDASSVEEPYSSRDGLVEMDFAYAITCHKSQGSEFDNVIIADDQMQINNFEFRKRWLYTACTRAVKQLTWIF
jgi:exodeoxyribonuclease-5